MTDKRSDKVVDIGERQRLSAAPRTRSDVAASAEPEMSTPFFDRMLYHFETGPVLDLIDDVATPEGLTDVRSYFRLLEVRQQAALRRAKAYLVRMREEQRRPRRDKQQLRQR